MAEAQTTRTYRGNCHCGAFVFEVKSAEITSAAECNCSICTKKGYLWTFPGPITIVKGDGSLKEYTFGTKKTIHMFCPTCAIPVMARNDSFPAGKKVALNTRTLQDLDIGKLERRTFDGQKVNPEHPYEPPVFSGPEPTAEIENGRIYRGSCHCGAVTFAVKLPPLDNSYPGPIMECTCSICVRGGYIWVYPKKDQVVVQGRENLTHYVFGWTNYSKAFCKTCGIHIMNDLYPQTEEEMAAKSEAARNMRSEDYRPVNIRALNDFDIGSVKAKITVSEGGKKMGPAYVNP